MKTLNAIQTLSKIGKLISKIIYICTIVGLCMCAVGVAVLIVGLETVKLGGVTLHGIFEAEGSVGIGTAWTATVAGTILCIGEFFVSRMAYSYFDNEIKAGTPFTLEGAKELLRLGISVIWIPLATLVSSHIAQGIIVQLIGETERMSFDGFGSVSLGVMFIIMSLVCRYGAECRENKDGVQS